MILHRGWAVHAACMKWVSRILVWDCYLTYQAVSRTLSLAVTLNQPVLLTPAQPTPTLAGPSPNYNILRRPRPASAMRTRGRDGN